MNPLIHTTKVILDGEYAITLPNGNVGDIKVVTVVSGSGYTSLEYNNGWGNSTNVGLGYIGAMYYNLKLFLNIFNCYLKTYSYIIKIYL